MKLEEKLRLMKMHVGDCRRMNNSYYIAGVDEVDLLVDCAQFLADTMLELKRIRAGTDCEKSRAKLLALQEKYKSLIESSFGSGSKNP